MRPPTIKTPLILIVDDSPQNLKILSLLLEELDCEIVEASNGQEALDKTREKLPDLILLDVMMPVMDGLEACEKLKEDDLTRDIPVIFLTALANSEEIITGFRKGAVDYISKPFNSVELLARVKSHLHVRQVMSQLEHANTTKNKFFSIIAHDLKNPFYTIIGFAEMLVKNIDSYSRADQLKYINLIYNSGIEAQNLLENLLNWSQIQIGTMKANKGILNSIDIVNRAIHFLEPMAGKKSIKLVQIEDDEYEILADEEMLNTILRNLGSNAIKFSREGGTVKFITRSEDDGGHIQFIVEDNGIGMSEATKLNLFHFDSKQSSKGTANETGTGLGLILIKEFLDYHAGDIKIESKEGKGSKFIITLPAGENV